MVQEDVGVNIRRIRRWGLIATLYHSHSTFFVIRVMYIRAGLPLLSYQLKSEDQSLAPCRRSSFLTM